MAAVTTISLVPIVVAAVAVLAVIAVLMALARSRRRDQRGFEVKPTARRDRSGREHHRH